MSIFSYVYIVCKIMIDRSANFNIVSKWGTTAYGPNTRRHNLCVLGNLSPSNLYYARHQIPQLKRLSSHLAVVVAQSIEARY